MVSEPKRIDRRSIIAMREKQITLFGGTPGLRDKDHLKSALARLRELWNHTDPPPDLQAIATSYASGLIKNHAFLDGNKRIALVALRLFLLKNGPTVSATSEDKYKNLIALASSEITEEFFANWLRSTTTPTP